MSSIKLIVGLGNPGPEYADTRHNVGAWLIQQIADQNNQALKLESKFHGLAAKTNVSQYSVQLLIPTTYMNHSGRSVAALCNFYKYQADEILVVHDELDLPAGVAKFKTGGGHGGHNGLRDIIQQLGNQKNFHRLRIGIGHPGSAPKVTGYVLGKPPKQDKESIDASLTAALDALPLMIAGDIQKAMNQLHSFDASN